MIFFSPVVIFPTNLKQWSSPFLPLLHVAWYIYNEQLHPLFTSIFLELNWTNPCYFSLVPRALHIILLVLPLLNISSNSSAWCRRHQGCDSFPAKGSSVSCPTETIFPFPCRNIPKLMRCRITFISLQLHCTRGSLLLWLREMKSIPSLPLSV